MKSTTFYFVLQTKSMNFWIVGDAG